MYHFQILQSEHVICINQTITELPHIASRDSKRESKVDTRSSTAFIFWEYCWPPWSLSGNCWGTSPIWDGEYNERGDAACCETNPEEAASEVRRPAGRKSAGEAGSVREAELNLEVDTKGDTDADAALVW